MALIKRIITKTDTTTELVISYDELVALFSLVGVTVADGTALDTAVRQDSGSTVSIRQMEEGGALVISFKGWDEDIDQTSFTVTDIDII